MGGAAYYEDADDDDFMDLGVQVEEDAHHREARRLHAAKIAQEVRRSAMAESTDVCRRTSPTSARSASPRAPRRRKPRPRHHRPADAHRAEIVAPSKEFTAPSSSFLFVDEPRRTSIMQYLPARPVAESASSSSAGGGALHVPRRPQADV